MDDLEGAVISRVHLLMEQRRLTRAGVVKAMAEAGYDVHLTTLKRLLERDSRLTARQIEAFCEAFDLSVAEMTKPLSPTEDEATRLDEVVRVGLARGRDAYIVRRDANESYAALIEEVVTAVTSGGWSEQQQRYEIVKSSLRRMRTKIPFEHQESSVQLLFLEDVKNEIERHRRYIKREEQGTDAET